MALQVTITGTTQVYSGGQTVLTANVTDSAIGQTPTGLQYVWRTTAGSFVGATNGPSVIYLADPAQNADQTVTITCEVTLPGNPNPTVSSATLTSLTDLGVDDVIVNMLIQKSSTAQPLSIANAPLTGSDDIITTGLRIDRIRWISGSGRFIVFRSSDSTETQSAFWTPVNVSRYSIYLIGTDGSVFEIPPLWFTDSNDGRVRWRALTADDITELNTFITGIADGENMVVGIGTPNSIGTAEVTASADATVNVQRNEPPVVSINAPARLNPGQSTPIEATIEDPENTATTIQWGTTGGTIDNPTARNPNFEAPNTSGPVTLTATARDAQGAEGSSTHVIVINSPPIVAITAPNQLEVGQEGSISAAVSDPNSDTVTVLWETIGGTIDNTSALNPTFTAPSTTGTVTLTCTATDSEGLATAETAQITIIANQPPTVSITAPSQLEIGGVGNLRAMTRRSNW